MCGRFTLRTPLTVLISEFNIEIFDQQQFLAFKPRYNIPPTVDIPVVRLAETRAR
jgi:putative SOS response-associated peptidase YedK